MLNKRDFKSIWEIAYRWEAIEPPHDDSSEMSEGLIDKFHKILNAFREAKLPIYHPNYNKADHASEGMINVYIFDQTQLRLKRCLVKNQFPYDLLNCLYIQRIDLLNWCENDQLLPPEFWGVGIKNTQEVLEIETKPLIGRHQQQEIDKNRCQAIAKTLWELDPSIHPAHMARSKAIRKYGNGEHYKGKDGEYETIKKWIREVDPLANNRKTGKPTGEEFYLIDLQTHCLKQSKTDT